MRPAPDASPYYADTPAGLFTAAGTWYHTREDSLTRFAAPAEEDLTTLLRQADLLVGAPRTLALWGLALLLVVLPWAWAAALTATLFVLLMLVLPALAAPGLTRVLRVLDPVIGLLLLNVFVLSLLAARGDYAAVWTGLAGFVLLRWGVLTYLIRPLADRFYPPSLADRVLRALIVRTALSRGVAMPEVQEMERSLLATIHRR